MQPNLFSEYSLQFQCIHVQNHINLIICTRERTVCIMPNTFVNAIFEVDIFKNYQVPEHFDILQSIRPKIIINEDEKQNKKDDCVVFRSNKISNLIKLLSEPSSGCVYLWEDLQVISSPRKTFQYF